MKKLLTPLLFLGIISINAQAKKKELYKYINEKDTSFYYISTKSDIIEIKKNHTALLKKINNYIKTDNVLILKKRELDNSILYAIDKKHKAGFESLFNTTN